MSASWEPKPAPAQTREFLVEKARAPVRFEFVPLVLIGAAVYAGLAWLAPLTSMSDGAVVILTILFALTTGFIVMSPNHDKLDLFRAMSAFYVVAFCVGILFELADPVWYLARPLDELLLSAAALALVAYLLMMVGYHLPFFSAIPAQIRARHERTDPSRVVPLALLFWGTGFVFFWIFFAAAGGAAVILQGEGGVARAEFGQGIGILVWPTLWMTPGGALYFAASAVTRKRRKWLGAWPLVVEFFLLLLLQGRHRALGPLIMAMIISHYLIRPLRIRRFAAYVLIGGLLSMVIGEARRPAFRADFARNPAILVEKIVMDAEEHARGLMTGDMGRLMMTMIVIDKVPNDRPYAWGHTLLISLNPVFRLFGLYGLQPEAVGKEAYRYARPELVFDTYRNSGFLPSIVGEMRWNFPWYICMFPYLLYGISLRAIYQRLIVRNGDFASVAIYAILGLYVAEMIIGTFAQNLFELLDVVLPAILISALARRRTVRTWESNLLTSDLDRVPSR